MWFGDLVTMRWFNDVWMKEVFANFMADKIVNPSFPDVNHELRFLLAHYPSAYGTDRTAGTNAIRQVLDNLDQAGQMYGPIIYDKAPIVMRQLEMIMGAGRVPRRPARLPEDLPVRQRHVARPGAHARRADAARSGGVEPRVGGGARAVRRSTTAGPHRRRRARARRSRCRHAIRWAAGWCGRSGCVVSIGDEAGRDARARGHARRHGGGAGRAGLAASALRAGQRRRARLRPLRARRREPRLPARSRRAPAGSADAWQRVGDAVGQPARRRDRAAGAARRRAPRAAGRDRRAERAAHPGLRGPRLLALPLARASGRPRAARLETVLRAGLAAAATQSQKSAWFNAYRDTVRHARRRGVARAGVAARGARARPHAGRARRDHAGDGARGARGAALAGDPRRRSSRGRRTRIARSGWRS